MFASLGVRRVFQVASVGAVIAVFGERHRDFVANREGITRSLRSTLATLRSCSAMLCSSDSSNATGAGGVLGDIALTVRGLGVQEVCGHTNLS